jgi:hypothetical protein
MGHPSGLKDTLEIGKLRRGILKMQMESPIDGPALHRPDKPRKDSWSHRVAEREEEQIVGIFGRGEHLLAGLDVKAQPSKLGGGKLVCGFGQRTHMIHDTESRAQMTSLPRN